MLGAVPTLDAVEVRQAVEAAHDAWLDWRMRPAKQRSKILRDWYNLLIDNQKDLAALLTAEQGKPVTESLAEINYAASFIEWFAEEAKRSPGR